MDKFIAEQRYLELIPSAFTEEKFSFCDKIRLNGDYFLKKNYFCIFNIKENNVLLNCRKALTLTW